MKHGLAIFATDEGIPLPELWRVSPRTRDSNRSSSPTTPHLPLAHRLLRGVADTCEYSRMLDPFVALMAAAAAT